jgi:beta-mannosidase
MTRGDHLLPVVASGAPKLGSLKTRSHRQPAHGRRPDRFGVIATNTERKVHGMRTRRSLTEGWRIKQLDNDRLDIALLTQQAAARDEDWLAAEMPAQVHDVLLMHGLISDPCISRNAADSAWVGEKDWAYACRFVSPQKTGSPVMLRFGGLDTLADAYLNGVHIGKFENMYREYASNVSEYLAPPGQGNTLLIVFSSPIRYISQIERSTAHIPKHKYLRKCHSDFGSYLGARPHSIKMGVYRDITLDMPDRAWIENVHIRAEVSPDLATAKVRAHVEANGVETSLNWRILDPSGNAVASGAESISGDGFDIEVCLDGVELWWPRTHGRPNLYQFQAELLLDDAELDGQSLDFGIRDVKTTLHDRETGEERFRFEINGQPIFLRGACWAPVEGMTHCWRPHRATRLLDLAEHGQMNVLRVWGEGHIPPEEFYRECDRRGILVWQDFMFGYGMHPTGDPGFDNNCRVEIEDMIRRLRNHPCILLWCGGNENHMGWDFGIGGKPAVGSELFQRIMPEACARLDPTRTFHPSSPFGGRVPNWPLEGDWHDYTTLTFAPQASVPLYASEVGRASAPSRSSMRRFLTEEELWPRAHDPAIRRPGEPAWPDMWQYRSVDGSWDKVGAVEEFCDPATAGDLIRVLGTAHGEYLRRRVERHRRGTPDDSPDGARRCWGNMVWRLNDSWPIVYWSVLDYYLEPKIPFYYLRRAYAPILICFERTQDRIAVWIVNDSPHSVTEQLRVQQLHFDGRRRGELTSEVAIEPGEAKRCLDTTDFGPISLRDEFLHASFAGTDVTCLLIGERYLHLPEAHLSVHRAGSAIRISTDVFVRQVALEMVGVTGAVFEDNFFDMVPGQAREVKVIVPAGGSLVNISALNADRVSVQV